MKTFILFFFPFTVCVFGIIFRSFALTKYCFQYGRKVKYCVCRKENILPSVLLCTSVLPSYYCIQLHPLGILAVRRFSHLFSTTVKDFLHPTLFIPDILLTSLGRDYSCRVSLAPLSSTSLFFCHHLALHSHIFTSPKLKPSVPILLTLPQILGSMISLVNR